MNLHAIMTGCSSSQCIRRPKVPAKLCVDIFVFMTLFLDRIANDH